MNQDTYQQHIFYQKYHDEEYNFIGSIKVYFKNYFIKIASKYYSD